MTAITLKSGSKKITSEISGQFCSLVKNNRFIYLYCGNKLYVVKSNAVVKAVK